MGLAANWRSWRKVGKAVTAVNAQKAIQRAFGSEVSGIGVNGDINIMGQ